MKNEYSLIENAQSCINTIDWGMWVCDVDKFYMLSLLVILCIIGIIILHNIMTFEKND